MKNFSHPHVKNPCFEAVLFDINPNWLLLCVEFRPSQKYIEVLTPRALECALIGV